MSKPESAQIASVDATFTERNPRVFLLAGVFAFVGSFQLMYLTWLYPVFGYYGFNNVEPAARYLLIAWVLSTAPALWMPIKLTRPSQLIYWVLYLVVFIPSMFVPLYVGLEDMSQTVLLMVTLFLGLAIVGVGYLCPVAHLMHRRLSRSLFRMIFGCVAMGLILWVIMVFHGHFRVVSFWDVYELRSAADDVMQGSLVHYAVMWLSAVIGPFFLAWGLCYSRWLVFLGGIVIQLLVYS